MKKILLSVFVLLLLAAPAFAQELGVEEIIQKANLAGYYAGDSGQADVFMTIADAQGRERKREFRILRMDVSDGGEQKFYVYFQQPADVAKMVYMVHKHIGKDDDRWLYLPALDLVRRIAASDKRSSFVGSHFVYEDVSGRGIDADTHEMMTSEDEKTYKIKNAPKDKQGVEFSYYYVWIDKETFMPLKAEYYDADDKLVRSVEAVEVQDVEGFPTVVKSVAKDFVREGETIMEFRNVKYDVGLTDDIFQERYLRRPPMKWLR